MTIWIKRLMLTVAVVALAVTGIFAERLYRAQLADQRQLDNAALVRSELRRLPSLAADAAAAAPQGFEQLAASDSQLYRSWGRLYKQLHSESAGQASPVPAAAVRFAGELRALRSDVASIIAERAGPEQWRRLASSSAAALPQLESALTPQVERLIASGARSATVVLAQQQLWWLQRLDRGIAELVTAPAVDESALVALEVRAEQIAQALQALQSLGDGDAALDAALAQFAGVGQALLAFKQQLPAFLAAQRAADRLRGQEQPLLAELEQLEQQIRRRAAQPLWQRAAPPLQLSVAAGTAAMVVYLLLVWRQSAAGRRAERHRHATQQAELEQLISALAAVGEGDLTRQLHADGETAAVLAASINSAVEALRRLVAAVARQSEQLGGQSDSHQRASHALAEGANSQLEQLAAASATLGQLASSIDAIASRAGRSRLAAEQARDNAAEGVQRVAESSASVDQIDAAISVAAGSLEALQTGAAEIGKVAAVITEIADQTNVLALNAAIQATGSGQEARGFAVVADEIQRLAESAAGAAAEIGELIGSVQSYSAQAGAAMVNSCAELAVGKQRIAAAGSALAAIEQGAQTLLPLIAEISTASAEQAEQSKQIAVGVNEVQQQAAATLSRSHANAASMEELARLAVEMRRSVSHFQLGEPETVELEQNAEPDNPLEAFEREIEQLLANTPKPGSTAE